MNPNSVAELVCKEGEKEVQRMLDAGIIFRVSTSSLVSPIALNKNEKSLICVDSRKLKKVTKKDPIPSRCRSKM